MEGELALALEAELEAPPVSVTSVCRSDWIEVNAPSESMVASWVTNWLGSTGSSGLWFVSCAVKSCMNSVDNSEPGSVDEGDEAVGEVAAA